MGMLTTNVYKAEKKDIPFVVVGIANADDEDDDDEYYPATITAKKVPPVHAGKTVLFYNAYANPDNPDLAESIVKEQLSQLRPDHNHLVIRSIGAPIKTFEKITNTTETTSFGNSTYATIDHHHDDKGDEAGTLNLLWQHCIDDVHSSDTVIYLHNKGSYHPSKANDMLRRFLTQGALSEECMSMPSTCNVCSSRMSPLPHPHTPGNMWVAKCEYIKKLIHPLKFEAKMEEFRAFTDFHNTSRGGKAWCSGNGRFAFEHWVHSHPSVTPCDLSDSNYVWGYGGVPVNDFEMILEPAPRFEKGRYEKGDCSHHTAAQGRKLEYRLSEYDFLYNETVNPDTWWGWRFWNVTSSTDF